MKKLVFLLFSFSTTQKVFAHADHAPGKVAKCAEIEKCSKDEISAAAPEAMELLIKKGKIPKTWNSISPKNIEKKTFKKGEEWVISYTDATQPEDKRNLFVFITLNGTPNGANFTGN